MFSLGTSDSPVTHADPIDWKSEEPVWVDQWPLTQEKLSAAQQLVQEQLRLGHIEPSTSAWNSPIFVIKKKSGKWRLLQDLRKPLFDILKGDSDPASPRTLSLEGRTALQSIEEAIRQQQITYCDYQRSWGLYILPTPRAPTGVLYQDKPLR